MTHCINSVRRMWFTGMLLLIGSVSLYDTFLIVFFKETIMQLERNPMGLWLLQIANGEVGVFVRAKLAGTLIVLCVLVLLRRRESPTAMPVTTSIAACQTGLLGYLTFG